MYISIDLMNRLAADGPRCDVCRRAADPEFSGLDGMFCGDCAVPDIHDPSWKGHGASTEDVLVAAPNVKNVTPR